MFGSSRSPCSTPSLDTLTIASFLALTAFMSTRTGPSIITPNSAARRATCAARALAIRVLVGMQPLLTQVPPKRLRSTIATRLPAAAKRWASAGPDWPVPMMMASKRRAMCLSPAHFLVQLPDAPLEMLDRHFFPAPVVCVAQLAGSGRSRGRARALAGHGRRAALLAAAPRFAFLMLDVSHAANGQRGQSHRGGRLSRCRRVGMTKATPAAA